MPTCLIADDEPLLRDSLEELLAELWPELAVVARARNGRAAIQQFEALAPDVCFLDVRMPGLSGIEAAKSMSGRAQLVFITAYDHYAVEAFTQGAIDYLVKPVQPDRLADTIRRLKSRLTTSPPTFQHSLLQSLTGQPTQSPPPSRLGWLRASSGNTIRLISMSSVDYLLAAEKYTNVGWRDDEGRSQVSVIRIPIKELIDRLDPEQFVQAHRAVIVALRAIRVIIKGDNETAQIHLVGRTEVLPVSRRYAHHFRQM